MEEKEKFTGKMYNIVRFGLLNSINLYYLKLKNYLSFKYVLSEYAASNLVIELYFVIKNFKTVFSIQNNWLNVCVSVGHIKMLFDIIKMLFCRYLRFLI